MYLPLSAWVLWVLKKGNWDYEYAMIIILLINDWIYFKNKLKYIFHAIKAILKDFLKVGKRQ